MLIFQVRPGVSRKPEEVLTWAQRLVAAVRPYKNLILAGIGGLALVLAVVLFYTQWQSWRENRAQAALQQVRPMLSVPSQAPAALQQLEQLAKDYPGAAAALEGEIFRAHLLYQTGQYADAARAYEGLKQGPLGKDAGYGHLFRDSLSYCYEAQGEFGQAAAELAALVEQTGGAWQGDILLRLARLCEAAGRHQEARQYYERLLQQTQDAAMLSYLREKLASAAGGRAN